jgi:hypothetical protein
MKPMPRVVGLFTSLVILLGFYWVSCALFPSLASYSVYARTSMCAFSHFGIPLFRCPGIPLFRLSSSITSKLYLDIFLSCARSFRERVPCA